MSPLCDIKTGLALWSKVTGPQRVSSGCGRQDIAADAAIGLILVHPVDGPLDWHVGRPFQHLECNDELFVNRTSFGWMLTGSPTWIPIPMASRLSDALQRDDRGHSLYSPLVFNVVADTCKVCLQISALGNRSVFLVLDTPNSYRNC